MKTEQTFQAVGTDELCPCCGEEITLSSLRVGQVELDCPCGCTLAVA